VSCSHHRGACGRVVDRMSERQIDDINAQLAPVCDGEVDCGDYVARVAVPIPVEHLQSYVLALRCETGILTLRHVTAAADQAGHVRAMPVVVVGADLLSA